LSHKKFFQYLERTQAAAVIVGERLEDCNLVQLVHPEPYWAFAKTAQMFVQEDYGTPFISDQAYISEDAVLGENCVVHPRVHIMAGAKIGAGCVFFPGVYVGKDVEIGEGTVLRANVVIETHSVIGDRCLIHAGSVIGADGFGFAPGREGNAKIPQTAGVKIGNDVEMGANCTIDRGALEDTVIGDGSKFDSQVHVAHGCSVGAHSMICGQSAMGGSSKLGERCIIGGGSSVKDHVEHGDGVILGGHSASTKDIPKSGVYIGFPAQPQEEWRKVTAYIRSLPRLVERLKKLENK
jgi:UDP-3-O-[3-hydroxymyristoyl] glucosamine N-acyltransferase